MPLSFPSSPAVNQTTTQNGRVYRWSGLAWEFDSFTTAADDARWSLFLPPAPTSVTATAGNGQATVSWTAPSVLSVTPVTDYVVQYSSNSGSTWTTFSDGTATSTSAVVTGLTNGTAYTFRVAGVNGVGTGAYSTTSSAVTPQAGDPLFSSVALLLHMDGSGSTFTDSSAYGRTVTANGAATQSADRFKFGSKSLLLGSGDSLSTSGSQFAVGTGDFTAEAWVYASGGGGAYRHVFDTRTSDSTGFSLGFDDQNRVFLFSDNGFRVQAGSVTTGQWYHLALCRASGVTRVFLDGTQVGSSWTNSFNYAETTLLIGRYFANASFPWIGNIDEVRFSTVARYTANFTPPTAAFPDA